IDRATRRRPLRAARRHDVYSGRSQRPHDSLIVDLDKAPRNAQGLVEFSSPFFILKPVDMAKGKRKILYGINNRRNKIELEAPAVLTFGLRRARVVADPYLYTSLMPGQPLNSAGVNVVGWWR